MISTTKWILRSSPVLRLCTKHLEQLIQTACYNESKRTAQFVKPHKKKGVTERTRHFVDYVKVTVRGGSGGNGMMSFSSLPNLEWAGPDGGNGGNGGHIVFRVSHNTKSLAHLKPLIAAPKGVSGKTRQRDGKNAPHLTIQVPLGTVVKSEDGHVLASLDEADSIFIAARGGAGGKGNYFFLSNENRAPVMAEKGGQGQERQLHVELKTMAHAGLIGFPNAGKSSLLRAISRAQPKVSPYPFTTLNPHIGMVLYDDHQQLAVADIPGLIPGSHLNKGMGHSFLRHIERCLCLVYVIDLSLERPWEQLRQLKYELNQYKNGLADRPALLLANKIDLPEAQERLTGLKLWIRNERKKRKKCDGNSNINESGKDNETIEEEINDENVVKDGLSLTGSDRLGITNLKGIDNCDSDSRDVYAANLGFTNFGNESGLNECKDAVTHRKDVSHVDDIMMNMERLREDHSDGGGRQANGIVESKYGVSHSDKQCDDSILVLAVSAKQEIGMSSFLHQLRVIYDSHLTSDSYLTSKDDEIR